MKLKNMWKRFWTLDVHNHEGFTLVELIIVIAILAILSTGAIAGYSAYVESANKTADKALLSEIENVLLMAYYNGDLTSDASVVLGANGVEASDNVAEILTAAYGTNWQSALKVKWNGWKGQSAVGSYKDTSYNGNEGELIGVVDSLTGALGDVIEKDKTMGNNLIGGQFETFLKDYKVDTNNGKAVGNAAVLYVAEKTKGNEEAIKNAFSAGLNAPANNPGEVVNNLYANLMQVKGLGDAAAMAAIYAYAEGYAQSIGKADAFHENTDFSNVTNVATAMEALGKSFEKLDPTGFEAYAEEQGSKDLQGYIDMMGTVYNKKDVVSGNLNNADCFTDGTVESLLKDHAALSNAGVSTQDGQAAVALWIDKNGNVETRVIAPEK